MTPELRDYQVRAIEGLRENIRRGIKNQIMCAATGAGKTLIGAHMVDEAQKKGKRALFVVDRLSLLSQTSEVFDNYGIDHGIVQGGHFRFRPYLPVQVCSQQTLARREWPEADLIIVDEAHTVTETVKKRIERRDVVTIGLSVGPASIVELRGDVFRQGFVGSIEEAFERVAATDAPRDEWQGFDRLELQGRGIETRGWSGTGFCWRPLKRMLRHIGDRGYRSLSVRGVDLGVTDDHSVFRVDAGDRLEGSRPRFRPVLNEVPSAELQAGDMLAMDDGADWSERAIEPIVDVIEELSGIPGIQVMVDVSNVEPAVWREFGVDSDGAYALHNNRKGMPVALYLRMRHVLPEPHGVRHEKSHASWVAPKIRLSDWAYMLGFWLGNGWAGKDYRIGFSVRESFAERVYARLENVPGISWQLRMRSTPSKAFELRANNFCVWQLLVRIFGDVTAPFKSIPSEWIVSWPTDARQQLLEGLMDSDGHRSYRDRNRARAYFTTTSEQMTRGLLSLLRSVGVAGSLHTKPQQANGGVVNGRQIVGRYQVYAVHWSLNAQEGRNNGRRGHRTRYVHDQMRFHEVPIRSVRTEASPKYVYDFEMDGGHPSFVANGVLVHNTATPFTRGLGKLYDAMVNVTTTNELIARGFLAQYRIFAASSPNMEGVKVVAGEWDEKQTSERAMEVVGDCVAEYLKHGNGQKFICSAVDTAHVDELYRQFVAAGVICAAYTYKVKDDEREEIIREFRKPNSYIRGLITVTAASKGFDVQDLGVVIMARPLRKSLAEHIQFFGRGLRAHPDKKECIVLDHSGNCERMWHQWNDFFENGIDKLDDGKKREKPKNVEKEATDELMKCPQCKHLHKRRPFCPNCGFAYPKREAVKHVAGTLKELIASGNRKALTADLWPQIAGYARERRGDGEAGRKMALALYKSMTGEWPLRSFESTPSAPITPECANRIRAANIRWARGRARQEQRAA